MESYLQKVRIACINLTVMQPAPPAREPREGAELQTDSEALLKDILASSRLVLVRSRIHAPLALDQRPREESSLGRFLQKIR